MPDTITLDVDEARAAYAALGVMELQDLDTPETRDLEWRLAGFLGEA